MYEDEEDKEDDENVDMEDEEDEDEDDDEPFYPPAGLLQLDANHCPASGPVPRSGIWLSFLFSFSI